jgi:DNA-binding FadR family transcriptional regulator
MAAPEYAFIASPAARGRARRAAGALNTLGYDARQYPAEGSPDARGAKALVLCGLARSPQPAARFVVDLIELPGEASADAFAFTAASEDVAQAAAKLLQRPVQYIPDPLEGPSAAPRAVRVRTRFAAMEWLARRAGVATDAWRTALLWSGELDELDALVRAYPSLKRLGRQVPLELRCITEPAVLEALAERLHEDEPEALRLALQAWSPAAMAQGLAACHLVLLPREPASVADALHAGRLAIATPNPRFGTLAEFAWIGDDPAEGIRWALANPRAALERLRRGQSHVEEAHAPAAVARAWARILMKGPQ